MWVVRLENKLLGPLEHAYHAGHAVEFYSATSRAGQIHAELRDPSLLKVRTISPLLHLIPWLIVFRLWG